jgi:hypothetical protein
MGRVSKKKKTESRRKIGPKAMGQRRASRA